MTRDHRYAQHFLRSPRLVAELVGHSSIKKHDTVIDLGAGSGVITSVLARRCKHVIAVETEPGALTKLHQNVGQLPNVAIVDADIRQYQPPDLPYVIFSNIPFSLSAEVVTRFANLESAPKCIYLITQRQFARKLVPSQQHFTSSLGASIAPWWQARIRRPLRKSDFTPPPAVDTVSLELKPRLSPLVASENRSAYQAYIHDCFAKQAFFTKQPRQLIGISPERKPSELTPEQWVALFAAR